MYAQTSEKVHQSPANAVTTIPTRATLQTRPRIQRACIRSWEYVRPVRITVLLIRMLVVLWLFFLTDILVSSGWAWGWTMLPGALGVFALSLWVFTTAEKGWPVVKA
jgi:hypothetical protein